MERSMVADRKRLINRKKIKVAHHIPLSNPPTIHAAGHLGKMVNAQKAQLTKPKPLSTATGTLGMDLDCTGKGQSYIFIK